MPNFDRLHLVVHLHVEPTRTHKIFNNVSILFDMVLFPHALPQQKISLINKHIKVVCSKFCAAGIYNGWLLGAAAWAYDGI